MLRNKTSLIQVFALGLLFTMSPTLWADIIINGFTDATNDRFTNSSSFIMNQFDLSGVGQDAGGKWATAISRNVVISAYHNRPSGTISFFETNSLAGPMVTRNIVSGMKIGSTDLYLAVLDSNLPNSIKSYSYATEPLMGVPGTVTSAGIYDGLNAYLFGLSPTVHPAFSDSAVGRNIVSNYAEDEIFQGNTDNDSILFVNDAVGSPDFVPFEAMFVSGDSGGPTFVDVGGSLVLLGTNAFTFTNPNGSGINYTGNQAAATQNFIDVNAVPEPSSIVLTALGLGYVSYRRSKLARRSIA